VSLSEQIGLRILRQMDPERAHKIALAGLRAGLAPLPGPVTSERLKVTVAGLEMPNPVGLAAGFDKNAEAVPQLSRAGFGFIELGAATPRPQSGNAKPRLFRLTEDQAVINRFGFNNEGMELIAARLARRRRNTVPRGINLGANKDSGNRAEDFARVLRVIGPHVDFATVNVSSPNTEKLRDLQGKAALRALLNGVMAARGELERPVPVFLKIAPDLDRDELVEIAEVARETGLDAIIATNTTLAREGLKSAHSGEKGGLSGAPLFEKSTRILAQLSEITGGNIPLIGVGGISTSEQAWAKIKAGASAVQLYSAMVYHGLSLAPRIASELDQLAAAEGFTHISDAVGTERAAWL
jgi:dihydroorotate dehydrogenase